MVPKREYHLEYNMVLRSWCELLKKIIKNDKRLLNLFRITPNIRIKFAKEIKENKYRELSTSYPHSDAWLEGPWGINCYIPFLGDIKNNNLKYYEPKSKFKENFLASAPTYREMQWVMKYYRSSHIVPKIGFVNLSDYAVIHNTLRKKNCGTRISIDTTIFVGNHFPHKKDRIKEYTNKIPNIGLECFIDSGQYETDKPAEKKSLYSHYTSKVSKMIKF